MSESDLQDFTANRNSVRVILEVPRKDLEHVEMIPFGELDDQDRSAVAKKMVSDAQVDPWKDGQPLLSFVTDNFPELKEVRAAMSTTDFATVLDAAKIEIDFTDVGDLQLASWRIRDEPFLAVFKSNGLVNLVRSGGLSVESWQRQLLSSKQAHEGFGEQTLNEAELKNLGDMPKRQTFPGNISMHALIEAWGDKETERLQFAPLQTIELGFDDGEPIVVLQPETSVRYLDLATGKTRAKRDEFPSEGEAAKKMAGRFQLKIEPDRAAGFQTFRIGGVDTFLGSTKVDVGDNGNWSRHLKQTPRQAMQEIHNHRWAAIRFQPNDPDAWKKAISNNDFTFNPATDLPLTVTFINEDATGWLRVKEYDSKSSKIGIQILRLQAKVVRRVVAKNEWYILYEAPLDKNVSRFTTETIKSDPQLGIGILIDIAKVADTRGFKFIELIASTDDSILVTFHHARPETSGKIFEVDQLMVLSEKR